MSDPLLAADRASLAAERGPVSMAVAGVLVFEGGAGMSYDRVAERLEARLALLPRYRQRLDEPTLGLAQPVWVDDHQFDLGWHLRSARLPAPGGEQQLETYVARELARRLDRSRPLWEMHLVDGLNGGRVALVTKIHHALVDGLGAVNVGTVLLDPTPEPLDIPVPESARQVKSSNRGQMARMAATPFASTQRLIIEGARRAFETSPWQAADDLRRATDLVVELAQTRPQAPFTPLNVTITPNRDYAMASVDLGALKAVGREAGGTVNDVLLAAVAGMLRRYLAEAGVDLRHHDPVALVPVSVRRADDPGEHGNRFSTVLVELPADLPDPRVRLRRVVRSTERLKRSKAVDAGALLVGATGWAPPIVSSMLARALGGMLAFNLVVSNIPGPQQPFYLNGCRLLETYPAVPLNPANQGLSVAILSYDGTVYFGLLADRALDPPLVSASAALKAALDEMLAI